MAKTFETELRANQPGHDLYFIEQFAQDSANPFQPPEDVRARIVGPAVVIWPLRLGAELPVDVEVTASE